MQAGHRIGAGKEAEIFEFGGDVLKLYRRPGAKAAAFREAAALAFAEQSRRAAPAIRSVGQYGERWGLVMSRAAGESLGELLVRDGGRAARIRDRGMWRPCCREPEGRAGPWGADADDVVRKAAGWAGRRATRGNRGFSPSGR